MQWVQGFNYRVTVHWIGSRKELLEILKGNLKTDETIVISCHGVKEGMIVPGEKILGAQEIKEVAKLDGKTVVNLGCLTGSLEFVEAFQQSGVFAYIAPTDFPEGKAAIGFISNLFLLLASNVTIKESAKRASDFDKETEQFRLFI